MGLPSPLIGLNPQHFSLTEFIFSKKYLLRKSFLYFLKKSFSNFQETELSYISGKVSIIAYISTD